MVGNCKLIIRTLNLIDIYISNIYIQNSLFSFRKFEISFLELLKKIRIYLNSKYSLSIRILIQILNRTSTYVQNISNNHNILLTKRILTMILRIIAPPSTFSIDTRQQPIFSLPSPIASCLSLAFSPTPTYYLDAVSTFSPLLLFLLLPPHSNRTLG